jgi:hypothetical protein
MIMIGNSPKTWRTSRWGRAREQLRGADHVPVQGECGQLAASEGTASKRMRKAREEQGEKSQRDKRKSTQVMEETQLDRLIQGYRMSLYTV